MISTPQLEDGLPEQGRNPTLKPPRFFNVEKNASSERRRRLALVELGLTVLLRLPRINKKLRFFMCCAN
jgi:hypothetical protein